LGKYRSIENRRIAMKLLGCLLTIICILCAGASAQVLTSIDPDNASQGDNLWVTITGSSTLFGQGSETIVTFSQASPTITLTASSVSIISVVELDALFEIPMSAPLGSYDVSVKVLGQPTYTGSIDFTIHAYTPTECVFEPDPAYIYYKFAFDPMDATVYIGNFDEPYYASDVVSADVNGISATIVGVLPSHPDFDGEVVELQIPIAPFLEGYGAPLDTTTNDYTVTAVFGDGSDWSGTGEVDLIGKSSASGGKRWIIPPNQVLLHGDINISGNIDIDDVVSLLSVIFGDGSFFGPFMIADCNCSHSVDIDDVIYLLGYIFIQGPFPCHE
jgi:hypothetical protein